MTDPFDDKGIHLKGFPDSTLLDIARNGAAQRDYRLTAVEILKARKSHRINHPDIQDLVRELEIELDGIVFENPAPSGALKASVTTKTMAEDVEVIDNTEVEPDILPTETDPIPAKPKKTRKSKEPVNDLQSE